ncbi:MAG TPA: VCBS repeat-containing protein [Gemmataceae bacterium]|nr:VCBS repeat-containing protein [Gemmataceae bacterium]
MRRLVFMMLVVPFIATAVFAQPAHDIYLSRVSLAANQLFSRVEQLRSVLASLRAAPQQAGPLQALIRRADGYYEDTLAFARMLQRSPGREQVEREYRRIDRTGDDVTRQTRDLARLLQSGALYEAASRIEHADQILAAAVASGGGNLPGGHLARVTRSLDTQAEELLREVRESVRNDALGRALDRDVRTFNAAVDRFRRAAEAGGPPANLQPAYEPLGRAWAAVLQTLSAYPDAWNIAAVRRQAGQVNSLVAVINQAVNGGTPLPPLPGPPVPNPGPLPPGQPPPSRATYAIGADQLGGPHVRVFHSPRREDFQDFMAYHPDFRGGVRVAVGDIDGDGVSDIITAPGPGMPSLVRVFNGRDLSLMREFYAFDGQYDRGVWVAAADLRRDGRAEIICGADEGGLPVVRVFDGATGQRLTEFAAYEGQFRGGVRVAVGDVNGDGSPDIITAPGPGRPALVRVFDGRNPRASVLSQFDAYELAFVGGAFVSAADFTGDGRAEVVTGAGVNGGPHVRVFDGLRGQPLFDLFAYDKAFRGGARVACRDVNRDGVPDIITAPGPNLPAVIRIFNGRGGQLLQEFMAYEPQVLGGAFVGCR